MTNQVNQAFEKWFESQYNHNPKETNGVYMTMFADGASKGYQAATQANDSEINSLKQRVKELQEDNFRLREAGKELVDRWHTPKWKDAEHTATFIHALEKAISSTMKVNNE